MSELRRRTSAEKILPSDHYDAKTNVDHKDVEHMSSLASVWWDPKGIVKALHDMQGTRVPFIRDGLTIGNEKKEWKLEERTDVLKGFKILDVGCGAGVLSEALGMLGADVVGLDPAEDLLDVAKEHLALNVNKDLKVKYLAELIQDHVKQHAGTYDAVVASEVIEHIVDKEPFLEACVEALKPGGSVFITTISRNWFSWIFAIIFAEFILGLIPKHCHSYEQFISPHEVTAILNKFNCRTCRVVGLRYEFLMNRFKYQSNTAISYALHAVKQCSKKTN